MCECKQKIFELQKKRDSMIVSEFILMQFSSHFTNSSDL